MRQGCNTPDACAIMQHLTRNAERFMKIKEIVKDKMDSAKVSVMLSLFMKRACSVECFRIARLVGNVDGSEAEFDRQSKQEFDKLLAIQGDVGDV